MTQDSIPPQTPELPPRVQVMRRLAGLVLTFERVWPAIAPALGLALVFVCVALLDLPRLLPPSLHLALLGAFGLGLLALFAGGLRRVAWPRPDERDRRLEADTGLRHQPLAVLSDQAATGSGPIWAIHVARARAQVQRLRLRLPRPMLTAADPRAIRALILTVLFACIVIAGPESPSRLLRAITPGFAPPPAPPAPLLQAWITPPAYTGLAPIFLKAEGGDVSAPAGAHLTISLTGGAGDPTLAIGPTSTAFTRLDAGSFQIEQDLPKRGRMTVRRAGRDVSAWELTVVANTAPVVRFPEPPGPQRGTPPMARLPWQVTHAYGVASLSAELHLRARPEAAPLVIAIPLPGNAPKSAKGARVQDLTPHPWAGLPVIAQLAGRDSTGLEGRSDTAIFTLPERRFTNPTARALMAVRKQLSLKPDDRAPALVELERLSGLAEVWTDDQSGFLNLRAIAGLLLQDRAALAVPEAQQRMWELALHLEEGASERTAKALEAARQALREALEAEKRGEPIEKQELERKAKELQDALQKRLQALSEQARRDPSTEEFNPDANPLDKRDMERLAEETKDAAKEGQNDKARDKLAELEKMLQELQQGRPEHGKMTEQQKQRAEKRERGQQQMSVLQDMVQREGAILDSSQARSPALNPMRRADPFQQFTPPQAPKPDANTEQRGADQKTQTALRRAVGELMQQYGDLTGEVPPNLGEADTNMRDSAQALAENRDAAAAQFAQRAIEALQKGGQSMRQQMAQQFGRGQGEDGDDQGDDGDGQDGDNPGEGQGDGQGDGQGNGFGNDPNGNRYGSQPGGPNRGRGGQGTRRTDRLGQTRDPLGRLNGNGTGGLDEAGDVKVPEQMEEARTRALQEELRRRGADRTRTQEELDYIDRLLKQF